MVTSVSKKAFLFPLNLRYYVIYITTISSSIVYLIDMEDAHANSSKFDQVLSHDVHEDNFT